MKVQMIEIGSCGDALTVLISTDDLTRSISRHESRGVHRFMNAALEGDYAMEQVQHICDSSMPVSGNGRRILLEGLRLV